MSRDTTATRIGILGGTFDPIHYGHLSVGEVADRVLALTRMYVVTASVPPHRHQPIASPFERFAMVVLAVDRHRGWRASDMELRAEGPSYTALTLSRFRDRGYEPDELYFVLGADAFRDIRAWHDYPAILEAAHFAVVARPGVPVSGIEREFPELSSRIVHMRDDAAGAASGAPTASGRHTSIYLIDAQTADVSGTEIRTRCENGQSIAGLVPPLVQEYIEQHGVYSKKDRRASDETAAPAAGRLHGEDREAS
jgi:nicotinate-nucleotide adenylyltransferase